MHAKPKWRIIELLITQPNSFLNCPVLLYAIGRYIATTCNSQSESSYTIVADRVPDPAGISQKMGKLNKRLFFSFFQSFVVYLASVQSAFKNGKN